LISPPDSSVVFKLANQFARLPEEPYEAAELQALCNAVEVVLRAFLAEESQWSAHDWLDGFVARNVDRSSDHVAVRGAVWVNAVRTEPCEVDIHMPLGGAPRATIRFASPVTLDQAPPPEKLAFRPDWLYEFDLAA
jgi:hypothetical protein